MNQITTKTINWRLCLLRDVFFTLLLVASCASEKLIAQDKDVSSSEREVFTIVEEQPSYEGGIGVLYDFLIKEIKYPVLARDHGIEGKVKIQFNIERDGSLSDVHTIRDVGAGCGLEVERVVNKVSSFKPGSQRGRTVKTIMILPVTFKLDPIKTNSDNSPQGSIIFEELVIKKQLLQLDVQYKNGAWHGTLKNNNDKPLPGANIVVEGTNYGRVSGLDGTFSVEANKSQEVVISYVGYESIRLSEKDLIKE